MLSKPHIILWLGMLVFVFLAFFSKSEDALDIQLYDTYFVIFHFHIFIGFTIFSGILGLVYWLMDWFGIKLRVILNFVHIFTTYLAFWGFMYFTPRSGIAGYPRRYYSFDDSYTLFMNSLPFIFISVFFLSQILFLIHIVIGIARKLFYN
jgi:cytochrome c oxidase subunit I